MANVQLLDGDDLHQALDAGDVQVFHYQLNRIGYSLIMGLGALLLAGAGGVWFQTSLATLLWRVAFTVLGTLGLGLAIYAAYWYAFSQTRFVGVSDHKLIIGRRGKAWSVDWSLLDAESLGFEQLNATTMNGVLDVHAGGQHIELHLYNAYVFLEDIQGFMFTLLKCLQQQQHPADEPADEAVTEA